ncbi:MAG: DsbA family protein [Erythrobacter sp.]
MVGKRNVDGVDVRVGLRPGSTSAARAQDEGLKQRLAASTDDAVERGAFGIPTIFVPAGSGRESMFFGKERLDQVEEALAA